MTQKIILVTGATDGIGKAAAVEFVRRGAHVILHGRNPEKLQQTQDEIHRLIPDAKLDSAPADLSSLKQVRAMAHDVAQRFSRLDVLLHNAGVFMKQRELTKDGFEKTFAVNHLAPFALTLDLLPLLRASHARVVTVSSVAHNRGRIDINNLNAESRFDGYTAYAQSKLANILFANELAEQEREHLTSNSLHPGVITTKLLKTGFNSTGVSVEEGAATSIFLCTSPDVEGVTGKYFSDSREASTAPHALDKTIQKKLWTKSMEMLNSVQSKERGQTMNITIIGAGNIGKTLGTKWTQTGHQVIYGVRNPTDPKHAGLNTAPIKESLTQAEVILLALPGMAVEEFANQFGADLDGKIVIDSTNNPRNPVANNLAALQSAAPDAHIVHAFRTLGWENFANPQLGGEQIDLFFAGDPSARVITEQLIQEVGLRPVYFGGFEAVPAVDGMLRAWFALAFGQGKGRRIAFKLLEE